MEPQQHVMFAGDWHGDTQWAVRSVREAASQGISTLLHVGDFGIWPGPYGKKYLLLLEAACAEAGVTIAVTPGNHEDWHRLMSKQPEDRGDGWGSVLWMTPHILVLPRAHRFTLTAPSGAVRTFVSLGGAPSVDLHSRTEGRDWWPEEQITEADVDATVAGGYADVMIAHDSPDVPYAVAGVERILGSNPMGWPDSALAYAAIGRERMTRAYEGVSPKLFFHGHYHVAGVNLVNRDAEDPAVQRWVVALHMQRQGGNTAVVDLETLDLA